jgi:hypothetical protein
LGLARGAALAFAFLATPPLAFFFIPERFFVAPAFLVLANESSLPVVKTSGTP